MHSLTFLINIFGSIALLIFAIKQVQAGVEKSVGSNFRKLLRGKSISPIHYIAIGIISAAMLQSSVATTLIALSFKSIGLLTFSTSVAVILGADLGSAIVVQLLSFELDWLVPFLLTLGGWTYLKAPKRGLKYTGRALLGIALILLALDMLKSTLTPLDNSGILSQLSSFFETEFFTAFLIGIVITMLMHSSVAVVLMCASIVEFGGFSLMVGLIICLGANVGSAMIPVYLTRSDTAEIRHIPLVIFITRTLLALLVLVLLLAEKSWLLDIGISKSQTVVLFHLLFNCLLLFGMPMALRLNRIAAYLIPVQKDETQLPNILEKSCLNQAHIDTPALALASMKREILRMGQIVETMYQPVMNMYNTGDRSTIGKIVAMDRSLNAALTSIRTYSMNLPYEFMSEAEQATARRLTNAAIDLEAAGDIISKQLMRFATHIEAKGIRFSKEGWQELETLHELIAQNLHKILSYLASDEISVARQIVETKSRIRNIESNSRENHFARLNRGSKSSFGSSDMHLEILRALKEFNSRLTTLSYASLEEAGELISSRLRE